MDSHSAIGVIFIYDEERKNLPALVQARPSATVGGRVKSHTSKRRKAPQEATEFTSSESTKSTPSTSM